MRCIHESPTHRTGFEVSRRDQFVRENLSRSSLWMDILQVSGTFLFRALVAMILLLDRFRRNSDYPWTPVVLLDLAST